MSELPAVNQNAKQITNKLFAPLSTYYHPSLFNWFIGMIAIATGISYMLFTSANPAPILIPYLFAIKVIKVLLLLLGLGLVIFGSNEAEGNKKEKLFYVGIALLGFILSAIFFLVNDYVSFVGYLTVAVLLFTCIFVDFSGISKMLLLVNGWCILLGIVFTYNPQALEFEPLSYWVKSNRVSFIFGWSVYTLVGIVLGFIAAREHVKVIKATAIYTSLGAFVICALTLVNGVKDIGTTSAILIIFALSLPIWIYIEPLGRLSVLKFINAFSWLFMIVVSGTILSLYIQNTFAGFLAVDMTSRSAHATKVLDRYVSERKLSVSGFSTSPELIATAEKLGTRTDTAAIEAKLKELYLVSRKFLRVVYINSTGSIIAAYPSDTSIIGKNVAQEAYFKQALATTEVTVSDIIPAENTSALHLIAISAPVSDAGVISGWLDLYDINDTLANLKYNEQTTFAISNGSEVAFNEPVTDIQINKAHLPVVTVVSKISAANWDITLEQPLQLVNSNYMPVTSAIFLISILSGISSIFVMLYIEKKEKQVL